VMSLFFLLGSVQAIFLAFLLTTGKKERLVDYFLMVWMAFLGLHLLGVYLAASGFYKQHPQWFGIDASFLLLEGPFLYLYVTLSTSVIKSLRWAHLLHTIPYCFFTSYLMWYVHGYTGPDLYNHISTLMQDESNAFVTLFGFFNHFHLIVYLTLSILALRSYSMRLRDEFSYTEEINLNWLRAVVLGLSIVSLFIIIGLLFNDVLHVVNHDFKAYMIYAAFSFLPFFLSFIAIQQKIIYAPHTVAVAKYERSSLSGHDSKALAEQVSKLMSDEKPYLNGKLTIRDLADQMNLSAKQLSQVINENFRQNFFNYVNRYRVEEAKRKMHDKQFDHLKILMVGLDCGFNTKSSFNSTFKKITGQTPSEYKASLSKPS
jgi:AraC-like DNA-binding protein